MTKLSFPKGMTHADTIASMRTLGDSGACVRRVFIVKVDDEKPMTFERLLVASERETENGKTLTMYTDKGFSTMLGELLAVSVQGIIDGLGSKRGRVMLTAAYLTVNAHDTVKETWQAFATSESMLCIGFDDTTSRLLSFELPEPTWKNDKDGNKESFGKLSKELKRYNAWVLPLSYIVSSVNALGESIVHAESLTPKTVQTVTESESVAIDAESLVGLV